MPIGYFALASAFVASIKSFLVDDNIDDFMVILFFIIPVFGLTHFLLVQRTQRNYARNYSNKIDMGYTFCFDPIPMGIQPNQDYFASLKYVDPSHSNSNSVSIRPMGIAGIKDNGNFCLWYTIAICLSIVLAVASVLNIYLTCMNLFSFNIVHWIYLFTYSQHGNALWNIYNNIDTISKCLDHCYYISW